MDEIRMYTKEELAQMPFGEVVNHINNLYAGCYKYEKEARYKENCLATNERIRENIRNENAELKDTIEHQKDEIVKLKNLLFEKNRAIEEQCNKIDEKEDYIGRLQMQITDMQEEIQKLKAELNSLIGYSDLDLVDKQQELERLKNLLKGKYYTIEQQLKVIDCYRKKEIRELKEKTNKDERDTIGYAPVNFVLEDSNSSYSEYAKHLMRKYEALTDSGFSHDDAMSLIPLWDDADFEEFKKGN